MTRLRHSQSAAVLRCVDRLYSLRDPVSFPMEMLRILGSLIPADAGYNEFGRNGLALTLHEIPLPADSVAYLQRLGPSLLRLNPLLEQLTRNETMPARLTDCVHLATWRRTVLYNECYRVMDCHYQMGTLFQCQDRRIGIPFNRSQRDFSDEEKLMLTLVRPHIIRAHDNVLTFARFSDALRTLHGAVIFTTRMGHVQYATSTALEWLNKYFGASKTLLPTPLAEWLARCVADVPPFPYICFKGTHRLKVRALYPIGETITLVLEERIPPAGENGRPFDLTQREIEVLHSMSRGQTSKEIGASLGVSTPTVRKHVEHILAKLKVRSRLAAVTKARDLFPVA